MTLTTVSSNTVPTTDPCTPPYSKKKSQLLYHRHNPLLFERRRHRRYYSLLKRYHTVLQQLKSVPIDTQDCTSLHTHPKKKNVKHDGYILNDSLETSSGRPHHQVIPSLSFESVVSSSTPPELQDVTLCETTALQPLSCIQQRQCVISEDHQTHHIIKNITPNKKKRVTPQLVTSHHLSLNQTVLLDSTDLIHHKRTFQNLHHLLFNKSDSVMLQRKRAHLESRFWEPSGGLISRLPIEVVSNLSWKESISHTLTQPENHDCPTNITTAPLRTLSSSFSVSSLCDVESLLHTTYSQTNHSQSELLYVLNQRLSSPIDTHVLNLDSITQSQTLVSLLETVNHVVSQTQPMMLDIVKLTKQCTKIESSILPIELNKTCTLLKTLLLQDIHHLKRTIYSMSELNPWTINSSFDNVSSIKDYSDLSSMMHNTQTYSNNQQLNYRLLRLHTLSLMWEWYDTVATIVSHSIPTSDYSLMLFKPIGFGQWSQIWEIIDSRTQSRLHLWCYWLKISHDSTVYKEFLQDHIVLMNQLCQELEYSLHTHMIVSTKTDYGSSASLFNSSDSQIPCIQDRQHIDSSYDAVIQTLLHHWQQSFNQPSIQQILLPKKVFTSSISTQLYTDMMIRKHQSQYDVNRGLNIDLLSQKKTSDHSLYRTHELHSRKDSTSVPLFVLLPSMKEGISLSSVLNEFGYIDIHTSRMYLWICCRIVFNWEEAFNESKIILPLIPSRMILSGPSLTIIPGLTLIAQEYYRRHIQDNVSQKNLSFPIFVQNPLFQTYDDVYSSNTPIRLVSSSLLNPVKTFNTPYVSSYIPTTLFSKLPNDLMTCWFSSLQIPSFISSMSQESSAGIQTKNENHIINPGNDTTSWKLIRSQIHGFLVLLLYQSMRFGSYYNLKQYQRQQQTIQCSSHTHSSNITTNVTDLLSTQRSSIDQLELSFLSTFFDENLFVSFQENEQTPIKHHLKDYPTIERLLNHSYLSDFQLSRDVYPGIVKNQTISNFF